MRLCVINTAKHSVVKHNLDLIFIFGSKSFNAVNNTFFNVHSLTIKNWNELKANLFYIICIRENIRKNI